MANLLICVGQSEISRGDVSDWCVLTRRPICLSQRLCEDSFVWTSGQTLPDACARCILPDICQLDFPYFSFLKNWEAWRNNPSVENIKRCVNNSLLWLIEPGEVWWGVGQMPSRNGPDYKRPPGPPLMWAHRATLRGKHSKRKHTYECCLIKTNKREMGWLDRGWISNTGMPEGVMLS